MPRSKNAEKLKKKLEENLRKRLKIDSTIAEIKEQLEFSKSGSFSDGFFRLTSNRAGQHRVYIYDPKLEDGKTKANSVHVFSSSIEDNTKLVYTVLKSFEKMCKNNKRIAEKFKVEVLN